MLPQHGFSFCPKIIIGHDCMNTTDPMFWLLTVILALAAILVALLIAGRNH